MSVLDVTDVNVDWINMREAAPTLTAAQAASRLGIKLETLYAYVSRGLLARTRTASGSAFDALEIEAFAQRHTRSNKTLSVATAGRSDGSPIMVIDTDIAVIEDDDLYFRGRRAVDLASHPFDAVAAWVWGEEFDPHRRLGCPDALSVPARRLAAASPSSATLIDRAATAVYGLAAADPLRGDGSKERLTRVGENLVAGIPRALVSHEPDNAVRSVVDVLWSALTGSPAAPPQHRALNAALILSIDHDLAISTFAARVAASARATGYAVVSASLGAFDSPLHGNASQDAAELLREVIAGTPPDAAIRSHLRARGRGVPGFGHPLYRGMDPRARALLDYVSKLARAEAIMDAVDALQTSMAATALLPNIDLALAALIVVADMPSDAGVLIFAIGRIVGWIANAAREYEATPLRLRPRGRYVGPQPTDVDL